jgi:AcrR family transcriptional regulator/DNA-binding XRE family transcriptional regulator
MDEQHEEWAELGARVREARLRDGLSLRQLAAVSGLSAASLSQLENGKSVPGDGRLASVGAALGIELESPRRQPPAAVSFTHWREYGPSVLDPVLDAALAVFVEIGYHGASVRVIADRCGMTAPALYHHYPSKQAMLTALLDIGMSDLLGRSEAARAEGSDPLERLCLVIESVVLHHVHRQRLAFIGGSEMRGLAAEDRLRHIGLRDRQQHMVDDEMTAAVEAGLVTIDDPGTTARALVTMCTAVASWYRPDGPMSPQDVATAYVDLTRRLVGAPLAPT